MTNPIDNMTDAQKEVDEIVRLHILLLLNSWICCARY